MSIEKQKNNPIGFCFRLNSVWVFLLLMTGVEGCRQAGGDGDSPQKKRDFLHALPPVFTDDAPSVEFSIPITNDTARTISFDVVSNSCSCTKSQLRQSSLRPKESTVLDARVAFHREVGPKNVSIMLRDEHGPTWSYDVQMHCYRKIVLPLNGLLSFGEVKALETYEKSIPLTTYSPPDQPPLMLTGASCADDRVRVEFTNSTIEKLPDGVSCNKGTLNVWLTAVPRMAAESAVIDVVTKQGEREVRDQLQVHWQIASVFAINPPRVFFRKVGGSQDTTEKHIEISRNDGQPFSIISLSGADEAFDVTVIPMGKSSSKVEIVVAISSKRPDRNVWSKLSLITDAPEQNIINIPLSGLFKTGDSR